MNGAQLRTRDSTNTFNTTVSASGLLVGAASIVMLLLAWQPPHYVYLLCAPMVVVMSRFPMLIGSTSGGIEIGFDSFVMIFLALKLDAPEALAIWSVGVLVAQVSADKRRWVKFFNSGLGMLTGAIAITVINATRGERAELQQPRVLGAVLLGAAIYFVVDFALSAIAVSLNEGSSVRKELTSPEIVAALGVFLAIDSIGFQAANIVGRDPWWSASLLAVPIATIMVAARARSRGAEHARRLAVMFKTTLAIQSSSERQSVLDILRSSARDLLQDKRVNLSATGPAQDELGARLRGDPEEVWVIGPSRLRARSTEAEDQHALEALVAVVDEALSRLRATEEMAYLTRHDLLTGLGNRAMFIDRVEHALTTHPRRGGLLAVLFCDLDNFKRINDSHGHAAGDELLLEVATRITNCIREEDTVARLGGDEFVVLLEAVADIAALEVTCWRLLEALRGPAAVAGQEVFVTATIGVAVFSGDETAETLLLHADMAMYHAKSAGKDRFQMFELSLGDERVKRLDLIESLRRAVDRQELQVHYQPVVDMVTGEIDGVEALARWWHNGEWVPPDLFIPLAEQSDLIVRLGDLIIGLVTKDAPRLRMAAGREIVIGINISPQQLQTDRFAGDIWTALAEMGDIQLVLEVTERDVVSDDPRTLAGMAALADGGIRFAIDDFGTGFSSIGYLRRLPVHVIKIDKSFVDHIDDDETACALVQSVVSMVRGLGLEVVVEGVERETQVEHLTVHAGVTIGQGYLFGKAEPCDVLMEMLERRRHEALA